MVKNKPSKSSRNRNILVRKKVRQKAQKIQKAQQTLRQPHQLIQQLRHQQHPSPFRSIDDKDSLIIYIDNEYNKLRSQHQTLQEQLRQQQQQ